MRVEICIAWRIFFIGQLVITMSYVMYVMVFEVFKMCFNLRINCSMIVLISSVFMIVVPAPPAL